MVELNIGCTQDSMFPKLEGHAGESIETAVCRRQDFGAPSNAPNPVHPKTIAFSRRYVRRGIVLAAFYLFACQLFAQPTAFATLKPERVETGDTISLLVIVSGVQTTPKEVDFIAWSDAFPLQNILSRTEWRRSGTQWIRSYTLIAFDSAKLELPPLNILLAVGKPLSTNALSLTVFPTPGKDASDMEPIRDIYREPVSWMDFWPWAAGALLLIILFFRVIRRMFRRPKTVAVPMPVMVPQISARDTALQKLQELQNRQLWKNGALKDHYAEISLIVREYLETNFRMAALESTTSEIIALLNASGFPANTVPLLREILNTTDMVKYAQSQPPTSMHEAMIEKARELIAPALAGKEAPKKALAIQNPPQKPKSGKYEPL